jgi:hypothetical protein
VLTHRLMVTHVVWRGMSSYIAAWCRDMLAIWPLTYAEMANKPVVALMGASHVYIRRGGDLPTSGPIVHWPLQCASQTGQLFQVGDWWPPGDCVCGPPETPPGADFFGVGCSPGPRTAAGRRTEVQTVTSPLGTVFPGTPARFFERPSWRPSLGGACRGLSTLVVQFVIIVGRSFIYEEMWGQRETISSSHLYIYVPR